MTARVMFAWALLAASPACTFDDGRNPAFGCDESCPAGSCYLGYCLSSPAGVAGPSPPGSGGSPGAGPGAAAGATGASGTSAAGGSSAAGSSAPGTAGAGGNGSGVGTAPDCAMSSAGTESCNGLDDDCDTRVDEATEAPCFPDGMTGCVAAADGTLTCTGLCAAGTRACVGGVPGACEGFVGPSGEQCGGTQAADEDCDGQVDDECPCSGDQTQRCYSGRAFSAGFGPCRSGTQRCQNGAFGACEGEVTPVAESCTNMGSDDDCDLLLDDVSGRGDTCFDWGAQGSCWVGTRQCQGGALVCVTPEPEDEESSCDGQDEDCDGEVDEDFDLDDDPDHCGGCGIECAAGQLCCGGSCHDPDSDAAHCGRCGNPCGGSQACCDGACVGTSSDDHCGGCGGCDEGEACCGGACVATNSDDHCGGCGGCGEDEACCGSVCVATNSDDHCGGCGGCGEAESCCGGDCVDTSLDKANCGGCGLPCGEACSCQSGMCLDAEMQMCP